MALTGTEIMITNYPVTDEQAELVKRQSSRRLQEDELKTVLMILGLEPTPIDPNRAARGACKRGHAWMKDNTYFEKSGSKTCLKCKQDAYYARKATRA